MGNRSLASVDHADAACFLEPLDHLFSLILMFAHQNVNMIRHDCARIACIALFIDNLRESVRDQPAARFIEHEKRMLEQIASFFVEFAHVTTGRLDFLAAKVKLVEHRKDIGADNVRAAAARIVGKPPAVRGPDEVIRDDKWVGHCRASNHAACGFALAPRWIPQPPTRREREAASGNQST